MEKLDALQQRHRVTAFVYAVQKKYSDDRGGFLAALVAFYGFLSIFPLLLAAFTVVAYVLSGDTSTIQSIEKHLGSYPILGQAITELEGKRLQGSPLALIAGVLGLVWGAMGLSQAAEHTMSEAWNIPQRDRPRFVPRLLIGLEWYAIFGLGFVASTFVASMGSIFGWAGGPALSALLALALNVGLFVTSFWVLSPKVTTVAELLPGAVLAGTVWTVLTGVGIGLTQRLAHANSLYGTFGPVLGLLAFLYLAARVTIYGIELNVVRAEQLWPRSLTGQDLTAADRTQLASLARRQERTPGQAVEVDFDVEEPAAEARQPAPNNSPPITAAADRTAGSSGLPTNAASLPRPETRPPAGQAT
ncbi:MAG TPA: YihY/virulence factor BrkB family protein [Acidimicrobiales bacterium]